MVIPLLILPMLVTSTFIFNSTSYYSPPMVDSIGSQTSNSTGKLKLYFDDACDSTMVSNANLANFIVLLPIASPCSWERMYTNFMNAKALSVVVRYPYPNVPSLLAYGWVDKISPPRNISFLTLNPDHFDIVQASFANKSNLQATAFADYNIFLDVYKSWYWNMGVIYVPGVLFIIASAQASVLLILHIKNFYKDLDTNLRRNRWAKIWAKCGYPQLILLLEFLVCAIVGIQALLTNQIVNLPVVNYFISYLSGFGFVSNILAALFWSKQLDLLNKNRSRGIIIRFFLKRPILRKIVLLVIVLVPLALDTILSVFFVTYYNYKNGFYVGVAGLLFAIMELIISVYFLSQSIQFYFSVKKITDANIKVGNRKSQGVDEVLLRLSRVLFFLSLFSLLYVLITPVSAFQVYSSPEGFSTFWIIAPCSRAACSLCRVNMFQPKSKGQSASNSSLSTGKAVSLSAVNKQSGVNNGTDAISKAETGTSGEGSISKA